LNLLLQIARQVDVGLKDQGRMVCVHNAGEIREPSQRNQFAHPEPADARHAGGCQDLALKLVLEIEHLARQWNQSVAGLCKLRPFAGSVKKLGTNRLLELHDSFR
jgi:hypothetical protein